MKVIQVQDGIALVPKTKVEKELLLKIIEARYPDWKHNLLSMPIKWLVISSRGGMYAYTAGKVH